MYNPSENRYNEMKYNKCGRSGLKLSALSLGFWHNFGTDDNFDTMKDMCYTAFDHGITSFDLANNYGPERGSAETNFGKILKDGLGVYRDEMVISTKAGYEMWKGPYGNFGSRKHLLTSLDQSLQRMGLDYVDIFYHHRPDPDTPLEESMGALATAVQSGKALYVGLSKYRGETLIKAIQILEDLKCPYIINQVRYNIFDRTIEDDGFKNVSRDLGKGIIAFSPLSQGLLTNRYLDGIPADSRVRSGHTYLTEEKIEECYSQVVRLNALAQERGQSLAEMALAWILKDDDITSVIIGASRSSQILDNIDAIKNTTFTEEELHKINEISHF